MDVLGLIRGDNFFEKKLTSIFVVCYIEGKKIFPHKT